MRAVLCRICAPSGRLCSARCRSPSKGRVSSFKRTVSSVIVGLQVAAGQPKTIPGDPDHATPFNLSITDVNEAPSVSLTNLVPSLAEDTDTTGTVRVADIVITDDALGSESLSLSGTDRKSVV